MYSNDREEIMFVANELIAMQVVLNDHSHDTVRKAQLSQY